MAITLADYLSGPSAEDAGQPARRKFIPAPAGSVAPRLGGQPTLVGGALRAGGNELQSMGAGFLGAVGSATGWEGLQQFGEASAAKNAAEAQQYGRPDLEIAPWKEGGASFLPWAAYQTIKQVPQIGAALVAGAAMPEVMVPAALARAGAVLPRFLGGGALRSSVAAAGENVVAQGVARQAAEEAGKTFARGVMGEAVTNYPQAVGSMYNEASQEAGGATRDEALAALGMGVPYAALDSFDLPFLRGTITKGLSSGNIVRRAVTGAAAGGAMEAPQEAVQTAMELSFREDLTPAQKADQIVTAAVTGAVIGGTMGGVASGVRRLRNVDAANLPTDIVEATVDGALNGVDPATGAEVPPQSAQYRRQKTAAQKTAEMAQYTAALNETQLMARQMAGVTDKKSTFLDTMQGEADPAVIVAEAIKNYGGGTPNDAAAAILRRVGAIEAVTDETGRASVREVDFETKLQDKLVAVAKMQDKVEATGTGQKQLEKLQTGLDKLREQKDIVDRARAIVSGEPVTASAPRAAQPPVQTAQPPVQTAQPPVQTAQPPVQTAQPPLVAPSNVPDYVSEGVMQSRTLADRIGVTTKVEDLAAQGMTLQQIGRTLAPDLKMIPEGDQKDFLSQVRVSLGIPSQASAEGVAEFAQWKQGYDVRKTMQAPVTQAVANPAGIPSITPPPAPAPAPIPTPIPTPTSKAAVGAAPKPKAPALPAAAPVIKAEAKLTPYGKLQATLKASAGQKVTSASVVSTLKDLGVTVSQKEAIDMLASAEREGLVSKPDRNNSRVVTAQTGTTTLQTETVSRQAAVQGAKGVKKAGPAVKQEAPTGAATDKTVSVRGVTLANVPGTTVKERPTESVTEKADRARAAASQEVDRIIDAARAGEKPLKASKSTQNYITALAKMSPETRDRLANVFTKSDNPFTSENFDPVKTQAKLRTALMATAKTADETSVAPAKAAEKPLTKVAAETAIADALESAVAGRIISVRPKKAKKPTKITGAVLTKGERGTGYAGREPTVELQALIEANDVSGVLRRIIEESDDPVYVAFAQKMLDAGMVGEITMRWRAGMTSKSGQAFANIERDGTFSIDYLDDGGMTNEAVFHELVHVFVHARWGALDYYTPANKKALGDTTDRSDATVAELQAVWKKTVAALQKAQKDGYLRKDEGWANAAIKNPDELMTYGITGQRARAFLDKIDTNGELITNAQRNGTKLSMWGAIKRAVLSAMGFKKSEQTPKVVSMLDEVLRISDAMVEAGKVVPATDFGKKVLSRLRGEITSAVVKTTPKQTNAEVTRLSGQASKLGALAQKGMVNAAPSFRKRVLYFSSLGTIADKFDALFKGQIKRVIDAHRFRTAASQKMSQLALAPYRQLEALEKQNPALGELTRELMGFTQNNIDPRKTWDEQPHLHKRPEIDALKAQVADANAKYKKLVAAKATAPYLNMIKVNEGQYKAQHVMSLWYQLKANTAIAKQIPSLYASKDPMEQFAYASELHGDPARFEKYWSDRYTELAAEAQTFLKAHKSAVKAGNDEAKNNKDDAGAVSALLAKIKRDQDSMKEAPYFHLGRFGDYFVAFDLRPDVTDDADGNEIVSTNEEMAKKLQERLAAAGFTDPTIQPEGNNQRNSYIRVDTEAEYLELVDLMSQLRKEGVIGDKLVHGRRDDTKVMQIQATDSVVQSLLRTFGSAPIPEDLSDEERTTEERYRDRVTADIRRFYIDQLPDIASAKVMQRRDSVQGFTKDMARSYAYRTQVGAHALANLSAMGKMTSAFKDMRQQLTQAQRSGTREGAGKAVKMLEVMQELLTRENERASHEGFSWIDRMKAYNHAYFLGMSPAYVMSQLTQPMTLLWPEIAKKQGFTKAAKTIAKVTPLAFKVLNATIKSGYRQGYQYMADSMVTEEALLEAKIPQKDVDFIMRVVNSGALDIGSAAREHGRIVEGKLDSKEDIALRYAASMGFYSEVLTRTIAALAARESLDEKMSTDERDDYVTNVIDQSMLNYSNWYISRASGKSGMLGPMTPLAFSFLQYTFQVVEKLARETHMGFMNSAATPQQKKEARRFMATHLTAMTVLAGSLGLPMASVLARVVEVMADELGDDEEPYDAKAAWRNFLADVFGKDVGEILARGVTRSINIDLSGRVGEADILPFTKLLTDKQTWNDAIKDWAFRTMGAPTSMVTNVLAGGSKFLQGDALGGMREALPIALRGPLESFRMSQDGTYVDKYGNEMPMSVGASDILAQAMGFTPAKKAEMNEAAQTQRVRDTQLRRRSTDIRNKLANAILKGDGTTAQEWMAEARKFDRDNPAYAILPGIVSAVRRKAQKAAEAQATNLPLGVSVSDMEARRLTDYANY